MNDAPVFYMVRSWMKPEGGQDYIRWLETKHMADILAQPGVLWARKIDLDQRDEEHWSSVLLIYGFDSRDSLNAYLASPERKAFWTELEELADVHRSERFWGDVSFALDAPEQEAR
jgi:antibiotic biosynthesis monooxygenase (ABM) superfamily enzyme